MGLYTMDGRPLQVSDDKVYSESGVIVGRISGDKLYGTDGHYVGTIVGDVPLHPSQHHQGFLLYGQPRWEQVRQLCGQRRMGRRARHPE